MRWLSPNEAQASAFSAPDAQGIAFRLPGRLGEARVDAIARTAFGHRAAIEREGGCWIVTRRPFHERRARTRLETRHRQ